MFFDGFSSFVTYLPWFRSVPVRFLVHAKYILYRIALGLPVMEVKRVTPPGEYFKTEQPHCIVSDIGECENQVMNAFSKSVL